MPSPEASTHISLQADSPWTELVVADSARRTVAQGLGELDATLEPGVYRLEYRAGDDVERELVALEAGEEYVDTTIDVAMTCAAPVSCARNHSPVHARAAHDASAALAATWAQSGLLLMIRNVDGTGGGDLDEHVLDDVMILRDAEPLAGTVAADPRGEWVIRTVPAPPGGCMLRGPRTRMPAGLDPLLEQPLWLNDGWQTIVFVPHTADGPLFADASVHLAPMREGWSGEECAAVATEALLWRLRTPRRSLGERDRSALACDVATAPMAAILLAHTLLRDGGDIGDLVDELAPVLPGHPDVQALRWLAGRREPALAWPPMLRAAFERAQQLDTERTGVMRDGSPAVALAGGQFREGVWTACHPAGNIAPKPQDAELSAIAGELQDPSTQRVLAHLDRVRRAGANGDARALVEEDTSEVAFQTSLPTAAVARALTDIEAALPQAAEHDEPADPLAAATRSPRPAPGQSGVWNLALMPRAADAARLERRLSGVLRLLSVGSALAFVPLLVASMMAFELGPSSVAIVSRSVLLAALFALAASDVRRFGALVELMTGVLLVETAVIAAAIAVDATPFKFVWIASDIAIVIALAALSRAAYRARHDLRSLTPGNHRTLRALSETVHGEAARVPSEAVAHHVDAYLTGASGQSRRRARLALDVVALAPILRARPAFSLAMREQRRELLARRRTWPGMERVRASMLRTAHQLVSLGYYADPRAAKGIATEDAAQPACVAQLRTHPSIRTRRSDGDVRRHTVDAVVVGSGAAGALIAYRLAERGLRTLILERGGAIDPSRDTSDALQTLPDLLGDGSLAMLGDLDARVHRVSALGGDCPVRPPAWSSVAPIVGERWVTEGYGLDEARFYAAWQQVLDWLPGIDRPPGPFSRAAELLHAGIEALGYEPSGDLTRPAQTPPDLSARSHAALDTLLPWGQRRFGDRLEVMPGCDVRRIVTEDGEPRALVCRTRTGAELTISARTVVVAAGAIGTAELLRRSDVSRGRSYSFNLASMLTADFDEPIDAHRGVQLLTDIIPEQPKFVVESTWAPVWLQSMAMPGVFEQHAANMRRYRYMAGMRVHVGIDRSQRPPSLSPRSTSFQLAGEDLRRLAERLEIVGEILFAAGARRVLPATAAYEEYDSPKALGRLAPSLTSSKQIAISARPQGGAPLSVDRAGGVVDSKLCVHGYRNLYACDASVFPTSVTRRPHLTAMAMAEYCAMGME